MKKLKYIYLKHYELIVYVFWGCMATVVSWGSYSVFAYYLQDWTDMVTLFSVEAPLSVCISNILSWICAFSLAFFTNKVFVFRSKSWKRKIWIPEFVKFLGARAVTGILEIVLVPLLVGFGLNQTLFGIEGIVAKIFASVLVVIANYIFSKVFIFKQVKSQK